MLPEFGIPLLLWTLKHTRRFQDYLESWADMLGVLDDLDVEADV